jgi:hypothetical protein
MTSRQDATTRARAERRAPTSLTSPATVLRLSLRSFARWRTLLSGAVPTSRATRTKFFKRSRHGRSSTNLKARETGTTGSPDAQRLNLRTNSAGLRGLSLGVTRTASACASASRHVKRLGVGRLDRRRDLGLPPSACARRSDRASRRPRVVGFGFFAVRRFALMWDARLFLLPRRDFATTLLLSPAGPGTMGHGRALFKENTGSPETARNRPCLRRKRHV